MANINLRVNGKAHSVDVDPATPLLYVLRNDLDLQGPRFGCGLGQCGACTVIIKGEAVRSCIRPISTVQGALCRCMTYYRINAAIKRASKTIASASNESGSEVIA